jgi:hypothetical protein
MYFFENRHFEIFTSKGILKPDILQPDILKTCLFVNLRFCKPDVSYVLKPDVLKPDVLKPEVLWVYQQKYVSEALLIDDTSKRELIKLYKRFILDFLEDTRVRPWTN